MTKLIRSRRFLAAIVLIAIVIFCSLWKNSSLKSEVLPEGAGAYALAFSPDGHKLLIVSREQISMYDYTERKVVWQNSGEFGPVGAWSRATSTCVISDHVNRELLVLDAATGKQTQQHQELPFVTGMAIDRRNRAWIAWGDAVFSGTETDGMVKIVDLDSGETIQPPAGSVVRCVEDAIYDVVLDEQDESTLLVAMSSVSPDFPPTLWRYKDFELANGEKVASFPRGERARLALSARLDRIAMLSGFGFRMYSLSGTLIAQLPNVTSEKPVNAITFSPVDPVLAVARKSYLEIRSAVDGRVLKSVPGQFRAVKFSPNGDRLIVSDLNGLRLFVRPERGW